MHVRCRIPFAGTIAHPDRASWTPVSNACKQGLRRRCRRAAAGRKTQHPLFASGRTVGRRQDTSRGIPDGLDSRCSWLRFGSTHVSAACPTPPTREGMPYDRPEHTLRSEHTKNPKPGTGKERSDRIGRNDRANAGPPARPQKPAFAGDVREEVLRRTPAAAAQAHGATGFGAEPPGQVGGRGSVSRIDNTHKGHPAEGCPLYLRGRPLKIPISSRRRNPLLRRSERSPP